MNMKRFYALVLMALLLCLPVWAMAYTVKDANGIIISSSEDTFNELDSPSRIEIYKDGLTISGNIDGLFIQTVEEITNLTLEDVTVPSSSDGGFGLWTKNEGIFNLTFKGQTNSIGGIGANGSLNIIADAPVMTIGEEYLQGIACNGNLTISGTAKVTAISKKHVAINIGGKLSIKNNAEVVASTESNDLFAVSADEGVEIVNGKLIVSGGSVGVSMLNSKSKLEVAGKDSIVIAQGSVAAVGQQVYDDVLGEWVVDAAPVVVSHGLFIRTGSDAANATVVPDYSNLEKYLIINAEQPPVVPTELPKTGDKSNVLLWTALACISLFGMTMLVRKRKEA